MVLLFIVLNAAEVLTYDIDDQLEARFGSGNGFDPQKKYWLKNKGAHCCKRISILRMAALGLFPDC